MQLAAVVEQRGDAALYAELVPRLLASHVSDVASHDTIVERFRPIAETQKATRDRIERSMRIQDNVVFVDLHEAPLQASGKFVAYALAPTCPYSVSLIRMKQHYKVSVGYNPWSGRERRHDIAAICKRHGGGGHPVVGAVSVSLDKLAQARNIAAEIVEELGKLIAQRAYPRLPALIGHRGTRTIHTENTLEAIEEAARHGARMVEIDVRPCRSGEIVVMHDETLTRVTDEEDPRAVASLTLDDLRRVALPGGERVPTLDEVLDLAQQRDLHVNVEIKRDVPARVAATVGAARVVPTASPHAASSCRHSIRSCSRR